MPIFSAVQHHVSTLFDTVWVGVETAAVLIASIRAPRRDDRRKPMIESRWKAVMALLGILSAVGTTAFGAGAGLAMYRADQAVLPQRLDAFDERLGGLERRIEQIDTLTAQSATLLRDLVCDLRIERGESPPECIRVFTPQPQAPGG